MARLIPKTLAAVFLSICFVTSSLAQSASPETTVDDFVKAWNTHEGKAFERLFTDDVIFVSVAEVRDEGRANVVKGFTEIHTTGWAKNTTVLPSATKVRTLRPDVAVVLFHISLAGRQDEQGKHMPDVDRAMLFVAVKQTDGWRIAVGQVTKQSPPRSPKIVDLKSGETQAGTLVFPQNVRQIPTFQDDLLDHLVGKWDATGTVHDRPSGQTFEAEWVLNHQFLRIHEKSVENVTGTNVPFEALLFIGYDKTSKRYVYHTMNVFGGGRLGDLADGQRRGNEIKFEANFEGRQGYARFIWQPESKTWHYVNGVQNAKGEWGVTVDLKLTPAK